MAHMRESGCRGPPGGHRFPAKIVAQQPAVAADTVVALDDSECRPDADAIGRQNRLADILLKALDDTHRPPIATCQQERISIRPVNLTAKLIDPVRPNAADFI